MSNLRFAPLIRVSTEKQAEKGSSLETQKKQIIEAVKSLESIIVTWSYCGQEHATPDQERQLFSKMLDDSSKGIFNAVIIVDPSRFSRDQIINEKALNILQNNCIKFFVLNHEYNLGNLNDRLFLSMNAVFNQYQAALQAEKSLSNKLERAKKNIPTSGRLPWGRTYENGEWGIDEEKKKLIEYVAEQYLTGKKGIMKLAKELDINPGNLWVILKERTGSEWVINFKGQKVKLTIPPLLPENIIEAIRRRSEHNKKFNRKPKHQYLLSGFIRCKKCGYTLSAQTNHHGKSYSKSYYRHPKGRKRECDNFSFIFAKEIEHAVLIHLFSTFGNVSKIEDAIKRATPDLSRIKKLEERRNDYRKTLKKIGRRKDNIVDNIADGVIDKEDARNRMKQLKEQESSINLELKKINIELESIPSEKKIKENSKLYSKLYKRTIKNLYSTPKSLNKMDFNHKRRLVEYFFNLQNNSGIFAEKADNKIIYEIKGVINDITGDLPMSQEEESFLLGLTDGEYCSSKYKPDEAPDCTYRSGLPCRCVECCRTLHRSP